MIITVAYDPKPGANITTSAITTAITPAAATPAADGNANDTKESF